MAEQIVREQVGGEWVTTYEDASVGSSQWGQESTAKFSYAGDPTGNVTPSAEGDLCVDTATPALYQATGTTSADWQQVGGSQPIQKTTLFKATAAVPSDGKVGT